MSAAYIQIVYAITGQMIIFVNVGLLNASGNVGICQSVIGSVSILWLQWLWAFGEVLWCWLSHCVVCWGDTAHFAHLRMLYYEYCYIPTDRCMFIDQASCHTPSPYLLVITSSAPLLLKSGVLIIQLLIPSAVFITFVSFIAIVFVHHIFLHSCVWIGTGLLVLTIVRAFLIKLRFKLLHYVWFSY